MPTIRANMEGPKSISIGLDAGTQSVKCVVCEYGGDQCKILATGHSGTLDINTCNQPNYAEQDPAAWILAVKNAISNALDTFTEVERQCVVQRITSVGVSAQQHGLVAIDTTGCVLRPCMLWCDTRATEEAVYLSKLAGRAIPAGFTAPKILWLLRNELHIYEKTSHFLLPHDYINYYLSGQRIVAMERGDASGTGLLDVSGDNWNTSLLSAIDESLHTKLPSTIHDPHTALGYMDKSIARMLFGMDIVQDICLSPGCGDNALSLLGITAASTSPLASTQPGTPLVVSLGTSGTLMLRTDHYVSDECGMVSCFADATGAWLPLVCIQNCGMVPSEIAHSFCSASQNMSEVVSILTDEAAVEQAGCDGVTLLPYFSGGERTPNYPIASGAILGLRLGHLQRRGLLYRAALEGVSYALLRGFRRLQELIPEQSVSEIIVVGGAAANQLWRQILADLFQLPVRRLDPTISSHAAAVGAAIQAASVAQRKPVGSLNICSSCDCSEVTVPTMDKAVLAAYEEAYQRHIRFSENIFG